MVSSGYGNLAETSFEDMEVTEIPEEIATGEVTIVGIEIDNSLNTRDVFLKSWTQSVPPDVGSTVPAHIFRVRAGTKLGFPFLNPHRFTDNPVGVKYTGFFIACVITGGTEGKTPPSEPVFVTLKTN